jgi:hypothetical protein
VEMGEPSRRTTRELNVHFSTIICLKCRFWEFGSTSNRPHIRWPCVTTLAQDLYFRAASLMGSFETNRPDSW